MTRSPCHLDSDVYDYFPINYVVALWALTTTVIRFFLELRKSLARIALAFIGNNWYVFHFSTEILPSSVLLLAGELSGSMGDLKNWCEIRSIDCWTDWFTAWVWDLNKAISLSQAMISSIMRSSWCSDSLSHISRTCTTFGWCTRSKTLYSEAKSSWVFGYRPLFGFYNVGFACAAIVFSLIHPALDRSGSCIVDLKNCSARDALRRDWLLPRDQNILVDGTVLSEVFFIFLKI